MDGEPIGRRGVLAGAGRAALGGALAAALAGRSLASPIPADALSRSDERRADESEGDPDDETFPQSVASADPTPSGVLVWTRVDPAAHREGAPLFLDVSSSRSFREATRYRVPASAVTPERDYTVRIDLDGALDPDRTYRYRFEYRGALSRTGRCRTLPARDASPDRLRLAVLTCQDYRNGHYGAYRHLSEADVDFLLHLGDFIYETAGPSPYEGRDLELPSGEGVAMGLEDFRHLHRTYRSDPHLRAALERHTLIATWDDHEIVNDRYWDYDADRPATDHHPRADDPEFVADLFADGIAAWREYLPTRARYDPDADHLHDRLRLWRSFRFGDLAELLVTDERLFRSAPPASVGASPVSLSPLEEPDGADRTMLGDRQREWFTDRISAADATWTVWGNEVLASSLRLSRGEETFYSADAWDGYESARRRLMAEVEAADPDNFVALTGDMHTAMAGYLQPRYHADGEDVPRLGVEFMAPAVTSGNLSQYLELPSGPTAERLLEDLVREENPHVEFFNSHRWGYAVVEFTPDECTYEVHAVDKDADPVDARREVIARLRVPAGSVEIENPGADETTDAGSG